MPTCKLSIVFLNFNRIVETRYTVEYLRNILAGREDIEVIAVDNGSGDGTGAYLQYQSDFLSPILLTDNSGIAGYNIGFENAAGEYILVLDDDSHPADVHTLDRLITKLDTYPEIGVLACGIDDKFGQPVQSWHLPKALAAGPSMSFIGCGFAIRRKLFSECGWYPARFFLYQNEVEVAMQVRMRGFTIQFDPDCRVVHRVAQGNRGGWRQVFYATRNSLWLIRSHYAGRNQYYMLASRVIISLIRATQLGQWSAYFRGLREGLFAQVALQPLPRSLLPDFQPFWEQNSLWHRLIKRT
jgi:GT2 family glycosyltransferase